MDRRRRAALAESPSCIRLGGLRARRSPWTVSESDDGIRRDAARLASGLGQRARRSLLAQATVCPETALSAPPWASDTLVYRRFMLQPRVWRYMRVMPGSSQQARLAPLVLANDGLAGVPSCSLSDDRRNRQRPRDIGGGRSVKPPPITASVALVVFGGDHFRESMPDGGTRLPGIGRGLRAALHRGRADRLRRVDRTPCRCGCREGRSPGGGATRSSSSAPTRSRARSPCSRAS